MWLEQGPSQGDGIPPTGRHSPWGGPQERLCRTQAVPSTQVLEFGMEAEEEEDQKFKASLCYLV